MSFPLLALFLAAMVFSLVGCMDAEQRLEHAIKEAVVQAQQGNSSSAINRLESLQDAHPDHPEIAEALAIAYDAHGNGLLASNYYQKAARLAPDKRHLLKASADGQIKAGRMEDAAHRLESYLESFPEDGKTWLELGRILHGIAAAERATDALTRGILLTDPASHEASDYQILGSLYLAQGDFASADYYLNQALTLSEEDPNVQSRVLVELAKSSVEQSDWDVADLFLKRLVSGYPEMVETAEVRGLQDTVTQILALREGEAIPSVEVKVPQSGQEDAALAAPDIEWDESSPVESGGATELESQAEPMVDVPAERDIAEDEPGEGATTPTDSGEGSAPVDSTAADAGEVEQDDPDSSAPEPELAAVESGIVGAEQELPGDGPVDGPVDGSGDGSGDETEESPLEPQDAAMDAAELEAYEAPENEAELLLIQAQQAIAEGNVATAIRMSWDSIHRRPDNPSGWFILSRAYVAFGQNLNAESAALEALRINPNNKKIVFNYLGILQRSRDAQRFHEELLKAYRRFPTDPDFVLALARSYARIENDPANAAALYRRFFDLAPADAPNLAAIREESTLVE